MVKENLKKTFQIIDVQSMGRYLSPLQNCHHSSVEGSFEIKILLSVINIYKYTYFKIQILKYCEIWPSMSHLYYSIDFFLF